MAGSVNWDRVNQAAERDGNRMIWKPYGLPDILDPFKSAFVDGVEVMPKWDVPEKVVVSAALTGAFFRRDANPNQPLTTGDLIEAASDSLERGATTVHVHVRDEHGYNTLDPGQFREVADAVRDKHPGVALDGCLVCALEGEWSRMMEVLDERLFDVVPINATSVYTGDSLFAKPIHMMISKAHAVQEAGVKPQIAVYSEADVDNAYRYLIASGVVSPPFYWIVLPALPGCSPMKNSRQMIEGLPRMVNAIRDIDDSSEIIVCAAGRPSTYLTALAMIMGLHVRVGMEDTIWLWPHRDDLITSNGQHVSMAVDLARLMGRDVAGYDEYREIVGLEATTPAAERS